MDSAAKLSLLQQQIDEAKGGTPDDFNLWRGRTEVVLRNVLGDANPIYSSFGAVRYSLSVYSSATPQSSFDAARTRGVRQVIALLEAAKMEVELSGGAPQPAPGTTSAGSTVFIVHGHDDAAKHETARFIRDLTGNEAVILHEQANGGRTVIEKFEDYASDAGYAIVLATGDDVGRSKSATDLQARARQNVVFELGFFFGALGRSRVAMLYEPSIEQPSDISGLVTIELDNAGAWKMLLAREIKAAGIGVQWDALGR